MLLQRSNNRPWIYIIMYIFKERLGALHVCAMWGTETMLRYLLEKNLDSSRPGVIHINQNGHFL